MAAIIFDFDGTIADSFDYVAGFLESHVRKQHALTEAEKQKLRGMTMRQMAHHLGSPTWKLPWLFVIGRAYPRLFSPLAIRSQPDTAGRVATLPKLWRYL